MIVVFNEQECENKVVSLFSENGYLYLDSTEILILRKDLSQVILFDKLEESVKRINNNISQTDVNDIVDQVRRAHNANLILGNKKSLELLTVGVKVYNKTTNLTETYKLIDFENVSNNEFIVTNQFKVSSKHYTYDNQIPDIIVYVNGLPLSVIELKSPTIDETKSIEDAYDQIKNYQNNIPTLFTWNVVNTISNMHINRYGSLTASYTRYSNWRDSKDDNIEPYKFFFTNLYDKHNFLMLIKEYSFILQVMIQLRLWQVIISF